jgi:putative ATPase
MAPAGIEDFFGQDHILGPGKLLRRAIESDRIGSIIFFGPSGAGKTALTRIIANKTKSEFIEMNAVTIGVSDIRKVIDAARDRLSVYGKKTMLLLDEIHHLNRTQQDALLPFVEKGTINLIGLTTENPYFYINSALISRSLVFEFKSLSNDELKKIALRALADTERGLGKYSVKIDDDALAHIIMYSQGDARKILNALEIAAVTTPKGKDGSVNIDLKTAEESVQHKSVVYDRTSDQHYDHISAFIKSMRGSDPDAALYWLMKMLDAGEDPRFLARRIIIAASEDVGNADPQALQVAVAALGAVEFVGMPEGRIPLAQATVYVACAPKSNASYIGLSNALEEVKNGEKRDVPVHLKDANQDGKALGHGKGYKYPHDFEGHFVKQEYMPGPKVFYEPSDQGYEKVIKERLEKWRQKKNT